MLHYRRTLSTGSVGLHQMFAWFFQVNAIATSKTGLKHSSPGVTAMREVAKAYRQRSLNLF